LRWLAAKATLPVSQTDIQISPRRAVALFQECLAARKMSRSSDHRLWYRRAMTRDETEHPSLACKVPRTLRPRARIVSPEDFSARPYIRGFDHIRTVLLSSLVSPNANNQISPHTRSALQFAVSLPGRSAHDCHRGPSLLAWRGPRQLRSRGGSCMSRAVVNSYCGGTQSKNITIANNATIASSRMTR